MSIETAIGVLELAIQTEREGKRFYEEAARRTSDPDGQRLFASLADDERMHERILQEELERVRAGQPPEPVDPGRPAAPLFSYERLAENVREHTTELSALRMGYLIERDAVAFYTHAAENAEDPTLKNLFERLAHWEREHQRILEEAYRFLAQQFEREMGFEPF
ncbi:MAG TPA: DUF2383 domain-containing protein [Chloroflexi bacterium]|nr:DUF2383 domain-containing protein [Chloroflexota bacterium]